MKRLAAALILLLLPGYAWAVGGTIEVTIPTDEGLATTLSECAELRIALRVRTADWTNPICAELLTRRGVRVGLVESLDSTKTVESRDGFLGRDWKFVINIIKLKLEYLKVITMNAHIIGFSGRIRSKSVKKCTMQISRWKPLTRLPPRHIYK